ACDAGAAGSVEDRIVRRLVGLSQHVRFDLDISRTADIAKSDQISLDIEAVNALRSTPAAPQVDFVLPADVAPNVEAERRARASLEAQRSERDAKDRGPTGRVAARGDIPDAVPVLVRLLHRDLRVPA